MNTDKNSERTVLLHGELTERILGSFYSVYNNLGQGFVEKVYENALMFELEDLGIAVAQQMPIKVEYRGRVAGEFFADLCVDEKVIVEVKSAERLIPAHRAQLHNYLKATNYEVGLLLNFGPKPEFERRIHENTDPC